MTDSKQTLAICTIVKDTPDYMFKLWVDHHFSIGVVDMFVYVDIDSKPIYRDPRVHYTDLTKEMRNELWLIGDKYSIYHNKGTNVQIGLYDYWLQKYRSEYDWVAFIDDDEFLCIDFNIFEKYKNESCIYLPFKMMYTTDIVCKYSLDNFNATNPETDRSILKSIANTKLCQHCRSVHTGDFCGTFAVDDPRLKNIVNSDMDVTEKRKIILSVLKNAEINYVKHYKMRSFQEWVESIADRKDMGTFEFNGYIFMRTIKEYFEFMNKVDPTIKYNERTVKDYLHKIGRDDVTQTSHFEWAEMKPISCVDDKLNVIIYNSQKQKLTKDIIDGLIDKYICSLNRQFIVYVIDYVPIDGYMYLDKNDFSRWMNLYNARSLHSKDEFAVCDYMVRNVMFKNHQQENIFLIMCSS